MVRSAFAVLFVAAVVFMGPSALQADDEKPTLSLRMYDVGALTHGRVPFRSQFPPIQDWRRPGDALLLISSDSPEPVYPAGQIDELIELFKGAVAPAFWEDTEGADIRSLGERTLVVRATEQVHADFARRVAFLEERFLGMVIVELQAVRLPPADRAALTRGGDATRLDTPRVAALLASEAAGPALRLVLESGTTAEGFGGAQRTFLRDHDVSIAQSAETSVAVVGVANPGLAAVVYPTLGASRGSRLRLAVRASLSHESSFRALTTVNGDTVELPAHALLDLYDDVLLEPGRWALLGGVAGGGDEPQWMMLVRATPTASPGGPAKALVADVAAGERGDDMALRMFDVRALTASLFPAPGTGAFIWDTRAAPPAGDEVSEPTSPIAMDSLVELVVTSTRGPAWEDPATIEGRGGMLIVRNAPATVSAVGTLIERLARTYPAVVETSVRAIEVSDEVARTLAGEMAGKGLVLTDAASAALTRALAAGTAEEIGEAQVASTGGVRNTVCSGKHVTYLQTYKAEVAESAARARPVTGQYLAGFEVELEAHLLGAGTSALLQLRLMHTREDRGMRTANTAHGPVELPSLGTARVRTTLTVPLGHTAWVASTRGEGLPVLFLATARLQTR